jgi:multiple sugar transport system permease protein
MAKILKNNKVRSAYLFIAVPVIWITTFVALPCIVGIILSFFDYDASKPPVYVGINNWIKLFNDPLFFKTLFNTIYYVIGVVPLNIIFSFILALLLNEKWFRGRTILRGIYFMPNVVSSVAIAFIWQWVLNPSFGVLNAFLEKLHIPPQNWFGDTRLAMPTLILISVWRGIGYSTVIYLAGLQSISETYFEAARIDGANKLQEIIYITIPLLMPTTAFLSIMLIISSFQVFEFVYLLTGGGPVDRTRVIVYHIWQQAFQSWRLGYASAMAVVLFLILLVVTILQFKYFRGKEVFY